MEVTAQDMADKHPTLMVPHFTHRTNWRGNNLVKCKEATCVKCLRDKNWRYFCTSESLSVRDKKFKSGWEYTPDHPDGFKWRRAYELFPKKKRLGALTDCPEGKW